MQSGFRCLQRCVPANYIADAPYAGFHTALQRAQLAGCTLKMYGTLKAKEQGV